MSAGQQRDVRHAGLAEGAGQRHSPQDQSGSGLASAAALPFLPHQMSAARGQCPVMGVISGEVMSVISGEVISVISGDVMSVIRGGHVSDQG